LSGATGVDPMDGLELVRLRRLVSGPTEVWFRLRPGDRPIVGPGEPVVAGAALAELARDARTEVVEGPPGSEPGSWWSMPAGRRRDHGAEGGELLFRSGGRWRIGTGDPGEPLEAPVPGIVREVRPGMGISIQTEARALPGADVLAGPSVGMLHVLAARDGHARATEIDVGSAGAILVAGSHIDAEAITRARAVGVRGIVVAGLGIKERRDVLASEVRGRAGVHGLPPFAILVLDGAVGRPIAGPVLSVLHALEGHSVAIVNDPPALLIDDPGVRLPEPPAGVVRVTAGPLAGAEGAWAGLAGPHRFSGGVVLEAGLVRIAGRPAVAIPLGDLERFA
jgi:hypothetical protein